MYLLQTIYPFVLASVNMALGWFLYHQFEPVFGGFLIVIGFLVIFALIGSTITNTELYSGDLLNRFC